MVRNLSNAVFRNALTRTRPLPLLVALLGAVFAFAWAIAGLLGLGETATYVLMAVVAVPGLVASASLTRRVLRVEAALRAMAPSA